jgi:ribonuclease I
MVPAYPAHFAHEYTEHGACNLFTMEEPFQGYRYLSVTPG